jgi:hypothetical protein
LGILESEKPVFVKTFIPELSIEVFDVSVILWFAEPDMFDQDSSGLRPTDEILGLKTLRVRSRG